MVTYAGFPLDTVLHRTYLQGQPTGHGGAQASRRPRLPRPGGDAARSHLLAARGSEQPLASETRQPAKEAQDGPTPGTPREDTGSGGTVANAVFLVMTTPQSQ